MAVHPNSLNTLHSLYYVPLPAVIISNAQREVGSEAFYEAH